MQNWETKSTPLIAGLDVVRHCNELGKQGWEPFHIQQPAVYDGGRVTVWFKRQIQEGGVT